MRKKELLRTALAGCLVIVALAACKDNNYDLSEINSVIGVGSDQGLALPGDNSTKDITLDDLLDLDDGDCITTEENGDYVFRQQGDDATPTTVKIDHITLMASDDNVQIHEMEVPFEAITKASSRPKSLINIENTVNTFDFCTQHSPDILSLEHAATTSHVTLRISFSNDMKVVVEKLEEMTVDLPDFFRMTNVTCNGRQWDGDAIFAQKNVMTIYDVRPSDGDILIQGDITDLYFQTIDETEYLVCNSKEVAAIGHADVHVTVETANVNRAAYRAGMQLKIFSRLQFDDFIIREGTGRFNPSIALNDVGNVQVTGVPDFLSDDEVFINLDNPLIYLDINSTLDVPGIVDGTLTSHFKNGSERSVPVPGMLVKPETTSHIVICRYKPANVAPDYQVIVQPELSTLFNQVPQTVSFDCVAHADTTKTGTVVLDHEYTITPSYRIEAPLKLNEGSVIVYNDSIDGWNEDLKDYSLSHDARVEVTADVDNHIPATITLTATAIDVRGNDLSSDFNIVISKSIEPLTETKDVHITITQKADNAFQRLDGIILRAKTDVVPGSMLNNLQTLKVKNIGMTLFGRVGIDVDSKD